jgi:hypothetical protein
MLVVVFLITHLYLCSFAQQILGIRNGNYAGIQGAFLNPSSIAGSKLNWDVNILSVDEVFDNTFLFAPKSSLTFFGIRKIIDGSIKEDLFYTHFDPQNPDKLYNVTFSTEIIGPSFYLKIAKKHEIGLTIAGRAYANIKNIPGNMAQNAFAYFQEKDLWKTTFQDNSSNINSMGWLEYGLHYATIIYRHGNQELKAGVSLNYLQGIAAAYVKNTHITYNISDSANINFSNSSVDYGRTDIDDFKKADNFHDLNHGHGFGADIGFTFVHLKYAEPSDNQHIHIQSAPEKDDYIYRLGISLIDLGAIDFNRNSGSYHLQANNADFTNWSQAKFSGNTQLDQTLSAVFYNGDSSKSLSGNHFNMGLPAALSIQADWNVYQHFFANATIIKGFGHGNREGVTRPDIYSVTPRYETQWIEVSVPFSVLYYNHWKPRVGLALRAGYFFIGGDAPGSLFKLNNLEAVDFYAGIHYFIPEKKNAVSKL